MTLAKHGARHRKMKGADAIKRQNGDGDLWHVGLAKRKILPDLTA
ncbi:hypothetical protein RCH09_000643 [Actimicrobium sp. GrIS 1.19]|nr:hypothetical protein [Actimicrobium sp. GrIS 1.19]